MGYRIVTESGLSRRIMTLNCLSDLRDPFRSTTGWKEFLPCGGTLGLESECLREAIWLQSRNRGKSSDGEWRKASNWVPESWFMILLQDTCCDPGGSQILTTTELIDIMYKCHQCDAKQANDWDVRTYRLEPSLCDFYPSYPPAMNICKTILFLLSCLLFAWGKTDIELLMIQWNISLQNYWCCVHILLVNADSFFQQFLLLVLVVFPMLDLCNFSWISCISEF